MTTAEEARLLAEIRSSAGFQWSRETMQRSAAIDRTLAGAENRVSAGGDAAPADNDPAVAYLERNGCEWAARDERRRLQAIEDRALRRQVEEQVTRDERLNRALRREANRVSLGLHF